MDYTRNKLERIVLGTLLNDNGKDGFAKSCRLSLRCDLFANKQNKFVYGLLEKMYKDGIVSTTPVDVFEYANKNDVKYGNAEKFCQYMCELAQENYAFNNFKGFVRELVSMCLKEKNLYGTTR